MSFMSEPQSREVLVGHSDRLLTEFDTQLRIIADRYLAFFKQRRTIETTYINSLLKLHRDASQVDLSFDPRIEPTTTGAAWNKIRDSLEREVNTRQNFVNTLDIDVINPLATLKEMGDQTRMRIKENLKNFSQGYVDHVENTISKLQQAYLKKYHHGEHSHSAHVPRHSQDAPNNLFGGKVSTLFRGRRRLKHAESEETVSDDSCREAVFHLNIIRDGIAENLEDGYNCLEDIVFTTTIKDVLLGYVNGMITACSMYNDLATNTRPEVEKALAGTDTSDLRASFRRALSFAIPPPALYRNYHLGAYSNLIFGVPLSDCMTDGDYAPKVIRMCIEEVEKRGLNAHEIYSVGAMYDTEVQELRRRLESEQTFSFSCKDNIHSVATLLKLYLWDLPEPLCTFPLRDYIQYGQNKARYTENNFSLLRSKIRELPAVHRTSLGVLCLHLSRVASHSDENAMTANALAFRFGFCVFSGCTIFPSGVRVKDLLMEDLIQNAHTLFDEHLSPSPSPPSVRPEETASVLSYSSYWSPRSAEAQAAGPSTYLRPGPVGTVRASGRSSPSISPNSSVDHLGGTTPTTLTPLLSPLTALSPSQNLAEGMETRTQEQVIPETRGSKAAKALPKTPQDVVSWPPTSAEQGIFPSQQRPYPEALIIPQSPPESVPSSFADQILSSATSLQSTTGAFH